MNKSISKVTVHGKIKKNMPIQRFPMNSDQWIDSLF